LQVPPTQEVFQSNFQTPFSLPNGSWQGEVVTQGSTINIVTQIHYITKTLCVNIAKQNCLENVHMFKVCKMLPVRAIMKENVTTWLCFLSKSLIKPSR
jgi:hypothetical protein